MYRNRRNFNKVTCFLLLIKANKVESVMTVNRTPELLNVPSWCCCRDWAAETGQQRLGKTVVIIKLFDHTEGLVVLKLLPHAIDKTGDPEVLSPHKTGDPQVILPDKTVVILKPFCHLNLLVILQLQLHHTRLW